MVLRSRTNTGCLPLPTSVFSPEEVVSYGKLPRSMDSSLHDPEELTVSSFEQLALLGEGGFGVVHLVRRISSNRLYALKELPKSRYNTPQSAQRVLNEAEAMQKVRHPFVMRMHGAFQDLNRFFFLLEFVSRGDLYAALAAHGPTFPEDWCVIASPSLARHPPPASWLAIAPASPLTWSSQQARSHGAHSKPPLPHPGAAFTLRKSRWHLKPYMD
jgi:hypothetical protein